MPGPRHAGHGESPRVRLAFLDGLRGLAALYVVLHHAAMEVSSAGLPRSIAWLWGLFRHGHYAVAVFIVLSGFCLMLPVTRDSQGRLPGGFAAYLGRRARRILPPYYAALGLCWITIALVPALRLPDHVRWDRALPASGPGVVLSHLLLVHNLDERTIFKVDPPMWSVATEWQIYLMFPALLALWRRHGIAAAVAAGFLVGAAVAALAPTVGNPALHKLCPWYAGLFALGMAGAVACGPRPHGAARPTLGRLPIAWGVAAGLAVIGAALAVPADRDVIVADSLTGAAMAWLIVHCARPTMRGIATPGPPLIGMLESRWVVGLGSFSYSLYLVHFPLLALAGSMLRGREVSPTAQLAMMLLVASPLCVLGAYLFHRAFERPFLPSRPEQPRARSPARLRRLEVVGSRRAFPDGREYDVLRSASPRGER